jgi:ABC-type nitrate/sulfonate/bicarbonate transport system substrate-binding protein
MLRASHAGILVALLSFFDVGASVAGAGLAGAAEPIPVRFVYDWPVADFGLLPVLIGQLRGYYAHHGLKVDVLFPPNAQTTARMLAAGRADIGLEGATDLIFAANQGVPVLAIANYTQSNSWCLIGRPGEPIDLTQLKGKSIGVFADSWTRAMMGFVLRKAQLREQDVRQIIADDDDIALLLSRKIDIATNAVAWGVAQVESVTGEQPTLACNDAIGVPDIPVWAFTAGSAWLTSHGSTARAWLAATAEALDWSLAHPQEAAALFTQAYPTSGSLKYNAIAWRYEATLMRGQQGYFRQSDSQWVTLAAALQGIGQIPAVKPTSLYFTNAYLPE